MHEVQKALWVQLREKLRNVWMMSHPTIFSCWNKEMYCFLHGLLLKMYIVQKPVCTCRLWHESNRKVKTWEKTKRKKRESTLHRCWSKLPKQYLSGWKSWEISNSPKIRSEGNSVICSPSGQLKILFGSSSERPKQVPIAQQQDRALFGITSKNFWSLEFLHVLILFKVFWACLFNEKLQ